MNIEYFNEFIQYQNLGIKQKTKEFVEKFINSFENYEEKKLWTIEYLPKLEMNTNSRIRNELFEEIIFPVLLNGYNNKNVSLMMWLVKLEQNYYQNNRVWKKLNYKTSIEIIMECYNLDPKNNDVIDLYLKKSIEKINFSGHEWPSGILYGNSFATKDECKILLERTEFVKALDRNKEYTEDINEYENNIKEYMEKLE